MIIGLRLRDRFASKLFLSRNTKGKRSYMNTSLYVRLVLMALGLFAISLVQAWDYTGTNVGNINGYSTNFYPSGSGNGFPSYSFESNIPTFTSNYPTGRDIQVTTTGRNIQWVTRRATQWVTRTQATLRIESNPLAYS